MTNPRPATSLSISSRLTLLYTLVALVAIALFAAIVYWQLAARFDANHRRFLEAKAAEQQTDLKHGGGTATALLEEILEETGESRPRQYLARLLDSNGRTLGETPGMQKKLPTRFFPGLDTATSKVTEIRRKEIIDLEDNDGDDRDVFDLITVRMQSTADAPTLYVQLALGITGDDELLMHFRRAMWVAFALLTPLLMLAGKWVASRGLEPLSRIITATRDISPVRLATRIPTEHPWPSELRQLVDVFNDMLTRLEEAFGRLSRFSADLAHELRTPLSNMSGELEVSLLQTRSAENYRAVLESNLEECRRLNMLIENLLFVARAERATMGLHCEVFQAEEACGWVLAQQVTGANARDIALSLEGQATICADPVLFRQAVANVLGNAIRHSPKGSRVLIHLHNDTARTAIVQIEDQGAGIPSDQLPLVFDRFYQVDPSRARESGQGTGLGLSIVKAIMEMHDGTIVIESTLAEGTIVRMAFPVR